MDIILRLFTVAAAAYLIGSLNGSLLTSRFLLRDDIRKHGSGNAGATNVLRTYGVKWTVIVLLWDVGRGVLAMWLGLWLLPGGHGGLLAGFFIIIGHVFPVYFGFRGGKGVITACVMMFVLDWQIASIALGLFILIILITRLVSLGSICAVFTLPFLGFLLAREWPAIGMYAAVAVLIIFLHRGNIKRLMNRTERKFSYKKSTS
jgi:glycerol-3-phosphate acyltransferase PlsY